MIKRLQRAVQALMGAKASEVFVDIGSSSSGSTDYAKKYRQLSKEGFETNTVVRSVIELKATNVTSFAWQLVDANGEHIAAHPILDLLDRPNPGQDPQNFWEQVMIYMECGGGCPLHAHGSDMLPVQPGAAARKPGLVSELYAYRPDYLQIEAGKFGVPAQYRYEGEAGARRVFPVEQPSGRSRIRIMNHATNLEATPFRYGVAPMLTAAPFIDIHNEGAKGNARLLERDAVPKGIWTSRAQEYMDEDTFNRLRKEIRENFTGSSGDRSPLVDLLDYKPISMSPKDLDWLAGMSYAAREIARAGKTPPLLLGLPGDNTYANYESALSAYWTQTILPLGRRIADVLNGWLVPMWDPTLRLQIDEDSVEALEPLRQSKWEKVAGAEFLTLNEKRAELGFPPISSPAADSIMMPAGVYPLSIMGED